jgi:hypothetical protein
MKLQIYHNNQEEKDQKQQLQLLKNLVHLTKHQKFQLLVDQLRMNQRQEIQDQMRMQIQLMLLMLKKTNMEQLVPVLRHQMENLQLKMEIAKKNQNQK